MLDLYNTMLDEFKRRSCAFTDDYAPYYVCSIGGHIFNLFTNPVEFGKGAKRVVYVSSLPYDTRVHIFFVAYSGWGKTFWLYQFVHEEVGVIAQSVIQSGFEGFMTEAGWVGTIKFNNGTPEITTGAAQFYNEGICACEEFSAISESMKQTHSRQLDIAMLTSLDSGFVNKRLGAGKISYKTNVTLWTGTQPDRYELTGGIGRRLLFLNMPVTDENIDIMKRARRAGWNRMYDPFDLRVLRQRVSDRRKEITQIQRIQVSNELYRHIDSWRPQIMPFEEPLFERLVLGYQIMKGNFDTTLVVEPDQTSKELMTRAYTWRKEVQRGSIYVQILRYIREKPNMEISVDELENYMFNLGYDIDKANEILGRLSNMRTIGYDRAKNVVKIIKR